MKLIPQRASRIARQAGLTAAVFISMLAPAAWAETDPPGRVGRLADVTGQVWLYSPDAGEWIEAPRNRPLTTGERLSTEDQARAEVNVGSTVLRLDAETELEVLSIDDERMAFQLRSGTVSVRLRDADAAREFELVTDEGRFQVQRVGRYRFDRVDDASHLTVWSGQALYQGPGSALTVEAGQRAEFWLAGVGDARYAITEPVQDDFAAWNNERDRSDDRSASTRYVSPEMTGVDDLDRHGRWEQAPEYGPVWIPHAVPRGWAPYQAGHWAWISPWGWTWVDDAPWGFAPFHYGRWAMFRNTWCWVPGSYVRRPVYAPALVAWVGGPQFSVSFSVGGPNVGWFPLAPREVYVPRYRVSPRYVRNVNITHVTHITNVTTIINNPQQAVSRIDYRNRRFPHAVTVVPRSVMTQRQPVAPVAAQWRNSPAGREWQRRPTPVAAMPAPHVKPPPVAVDVRRRAHEPCEARRPVVRRAGTAPPRPVVVVPQERRGREHNDKGRVVRPVVRHPGGVAAAAPIVRPAAPAVRPAEAPILRNPEPRRRAHEARPEVAPVAVAPPLVGKVITPQPMLRGHPRVVEKQRQDESKRQDEPKRMRGDREDRDLRGRWRQNAQ